MLAFWNRTVEVYCQNWLFQMVVIPGKLSFEVSCGLHGVARV
jgi:hypothetical protein